MSEMNVVTAPKTGTFQLRINPEVKAEAERVFARCGLTLTDAFNVFLQQALNAGGMPFLVTADTRESLRQQATAMLAAEIRKGRESVQTEADWRTEEDAAREMGVEL